MCNVLNAKPLRDFAHRAATRIPLQHVAKRFERLVYDQLRRDARNFRPARLVEIETGPAWARTAYAEGQVISTARLNPGVATRMHKIARQLANTCALAISTAKRPADAAIIAAASAFLERLDRASFDVMALKAAYFSRTLADMLASDDEEMCCEASVVQATCGRYWRRIASVAELRATGREFRNCIARTPREGSYGGMLRHGTAQFWVLRDESGEGRVVAMAPAPFATSFTEVRGPGNAHVNLEHPDLVRLARAIGVRPSSPPPPSRVLSLTPDLLYLDTPHLRHLIEGAALRRRARAL